MVFFDGLADGASAPVGATARALAGALWSPVFAQRTLSGFPTRAGTSPVLRSLRTDSPRDPALFPARLRPVHV